MDFLVNLVFPSNVFVFFVLVWFFGHAMWKFWGQGSNSSHSHNRTTAMTMTSP